MSIVPSDGHLEIEARVSNKDIAFVHECEEAEIKIGTFDFTRYGLIHGKVQSVSQDAIVREKPQGKTEDQHRPGDETQDSQPEGQELVYSTRVSLDKTQMQVDDRLVSLEPGMAVTVEIKTGSRRIIQYLLSPLLRHKQQAMCGAT
jgi:hemolysin D